MGTSPPISKGILMLGAVLGLVAFGLGLALAEIYLPEWREVAPQPERVFRERFSELVAQPGFLPVRYEPRVRLVTRRVLEYEPFRAMGERGKDWLLATHTGIRVEVFQEVR